MSNPQQEAQISVRERLVIYLTIFLIKLIKPWAYDHQFDAFFKEIKEVINPNTPPTA